MTSNEINTVIDNLSQKLGVAKEAMVPKMAQMCFTRHLVNSIFCLVLLVIAAWILYRSFKIHSSEKSSWDDKEHAEIAMLFCGFASIGIFISLWMNVYEAVQWYAAPTAKTFEYIMQLL